VHEILGITGHAARLDHLAYKEVRVVLRMIIAWG